MSQSYKFNLQQHFLLLLLKSLVQTFTIIKKRYNDFNYYYNEYIHDRNYIYGHTVPNSEEYKFIKNRYIRYTYTMFNNFENHQTSILVFRDPNSLKL